MGERQCGYPHFSRAVGCWGGIFTSAFAFLCYGNLFQDLLEGLGSPCEFCWEMLQLFAEGGADVNVALPAQRPGGTHTSTAPHICGDPHGPAWCSTAVVNHLKCSVQGLGSALTPFVSCYFPLKVRRELHQMLQLIRAVFCSHLRVLPEHKLAVAEGCGSN